MEAWRKTWRDAVAPRLPLRGLEALAEALRSDDPRLLQGATTSPPPLNSVKDWPVEGADAVAFALWQAAENDADRCVYAVEEGFARVCFEADQVMGEPAGCRFWLNHWDDTPRAQVFAELLPEVERSIREARERVGVR